MPHPLTFADLPKSLQEWRSSGWERKEARPRDIWTPLEEYFLTKGITLWTKHRDIVCKPPNDSPRSPDGFSHTTIYNYERNRSPIFDHVRATHCPARTSDNRDVLIRLVAKGDQGLNHLKALRRVASGLVASRGENHALPVLQEFCCDDMTFVAFPLVCEGFSQPWYYDLDEVLDAIFQVLEGITFCHKNLVAHLDIDNDNILVNVRGGPYQDPRFALVPLAGPFRKLFPVRYFINDFEFAVCYEPDSDPATRRVRGLPTNGIMAGEYGRIAAPEMSSDTPYCPFRADVWQLGRMFNEEFGHLVDVSRPMVELFAEMTADDPEARPIVSEALERIRNLRATLSPEDLATRVLRPPHHPLQEG